MAPDATQPTLDRVGNYDLINMIAEGGMGKVYKGRSRATGELVAIKIIPPATAKNPTLVKRFEREFSAAHELDHPNIVKAIEFGRGETPFLVMEYVDGESLGQRIERQGKLSEDESIRIIAQVCQGLHRAHKQNLIHRDVKPDNVLMTSDGVAKLTDLGLVKDVGEELNLTRTGRGLGTPHFMAPEQFRDAKGADIRCDIYSLGATIYMMVTGVMPFSGCGPLDCWMKKVRNDFTPPKELNPQLSERVNWAILRAMSADPEQRPASCREFVEDLLGHSTRPVKAGEVKQDTDVWYLVYKDEVGDQHTVKGTTDGIRRALKDNLLGDASNIVASRTKQGPFVPVKNHPEFRDLVVTAAPLPTGGKGTKQSSAQKIPAAAAAARGTASTSSEMKSNTMSGRTPTPNSGAVPAHPASPSAVKLPYFRLAMKPGPSQIEWLMWILVFVLGCAAAAAIYVKFFSGRGGL